MTLTVAQSITVAILAFSSFFCGWFFYRLRAKAREADLHKIVLETKGMIPQLESIVRNREQRIAALADEVGDWKSRIPVLEAGIKDKERELLARDRALRALNTELTLLKDTVAEHEAEAASRSAPGVDHQALTELRERLTASEQRCAELVDQLNKATASASTTAATQVPYDLTALVSAARDQSARIQALESELTTRDRAIADLEERLRAESAHGYTLVEKLEAQDVQIQQEREEIAKWRARVPRLVESLKERDDRLAELDARLTASEAARSEAVSRGEELDSALAEARAARLAAEAEALVAHEATRAAEDAVRSADERAAVLSSDVERLRMRQGELEVALAEQTRMVAERDAQIGRLGVEADESRKEFARKLATSIRLGREEIERMNHQLGVEVDRLTRELGDALTRRNDADEALAEMRGRFESERGHVAELQAAAPAAASDKRAADERIAALERSVSLAEARIQDEQARVRAIDAERGNAMARSADLAAALDRARSEIEAAVAETAAVHKRQLGLDAECEHLRQRLAEAAADHRTSFERARELETLLEAQRSDVENAAADRATAEATHRHLEAERDQLRQQMAGLNEELRTSVESIRVLEASLDAARAEARVASANADASMQVRLSGLEAECEHLKQRLVETEGDLQASLERMSERETEFAQRQSADQTLTALRGGHEQAQAALRAELESARARVAPLEELIAQRDASLSEHAARIADLQERISMLEASLERSAGHVAALEREAATAAVDRLPPNEKVEYLEQRIATQFEKQRELTRTLEERERKLVELERDRNLKDKSLTVLQQQLEHLTETNERLSLAVRDQKAQELPARVSVTPVPPPEADGSGVVPTEPQGLFAARPESVDDLQQIRGVGAAFEHKLNALGIYQYRQIASLNEAEALWVENALHVFRGRIGRDDWIGQALDLLAGKVWRPGPAIDSIGVGNRTSP